MQCEPKLTRAPHQNVSVTPLKNASTSTQSETFSRRMNSHRLEVQQIKIALPSIFFGGGGPFGLGCRKFPCLRRFQQPFRENEHGDQQQHVFADWLGAESIRRHPPCAKRHHQLRTSLVRKFARHNMLASMLYRISGITVFALAGEPPRFSKGVDESEITVGSVRSGAKCHSPARYLHYWDWVPVTTIS